MKKDLTTLFGSEFYAEVGRRADKEKAGKLIAELQSWADSDLTDAELLEKLEKLIDKTPEADRIELMYALAYLASTHKRDTEFVYSEEPWEIREGNTTVLPPFLEAKDDLEDRFNHLYSVH